MSFGAEVVTLVLYSVQQFGVVLGVGAQAIILVTYLASTRDRFIDAKEEQFGRTVHKVLALGLFLIIVSGAAITAMHYMAGEMAIIFSPAFQFKWLLIGILVVAEIVRHKKMFPHFFWEGVVGANWFALFVIHILAPIALWMDLFVLYAIWTAGFTLSFTAAVYATRVPSAKKVEAPKKVETIGPTTIVKKEAPQPIVLAKIVVPPPPKPIPPPPPPAPKPAPPPPPTKPPVLEVPKKPVLPMPLPPEKYAPPQNLPGAIDPNEIPGLPAIRVMPRTPEEVADQHRASVVRLGQ